MIHFERAQKIRQLELNLIDFEGLLLPNYRELDIAELSKARLMFDFINSQIDWFKGDCSEILAQVEQLKMTCLHVETQLFPNHVELGSIDLTNAQLIIRFIDDEILWLEERV